MITSQVVGADTTAAFMYGMSTSAAAITRSAVAHQGGRYRALVRARASGRPGPNIITKRYWNSIGMRLLTQGDSSQALIGTDSPQGKRLELGFTGEDSLGRRYSQPPFPHFEVDLDAVADALQNEIASIVGTASVQVGRSSITPR